MTLNSLSFPAMRYVLGRKTYMVETVCRTLINNAEHIRPDIKQRMSEEIEKAIAENQAGMDCDVHQWKQVLKSFKETE